MFEESIFERILKAWSFDQNHPYRDRRKKPLPSIADLRVLTETSFLASLKREEDKPVVFAIALLPRYEMQKEQMSSYRKQLILNFDKSLPFNETSIIKMSSAFDLKTSALLVGPKENNHNEYELWGIMFFKPSESRFTKVPATLHGFNYFRPDVMMITAVSPGSLVISRGDGQIGHFASGVFTASGPTPFTSSAMGKYMLECIKEDVGYKEYKDSYWHIFRDSVDYLLSEASIRGHGSIIVIVPEQVQNKCKEKYFDGYSFDQGVELEKLFLHLSNTKNGDDPLFSVLCHRLIAERLSFLAQLSCVDGALILNSRFKPLSFGSTLNSNKWGGKVMSGPNGSNPGEQELDIRIWGTRHNSAIDFIGDFYEAISFVISQDGPIRGFVRKDDNTILCWSDCRDAMFI